LIKDKDKEKEEIQYFANLVVTQAKEQLQKILNDFWLLDSWEYSIIKDLINDQMEKYRKYIRRFETEDNVRGLIDVAGFLSDESKEILKAYYENQRMLAFYTVMKEKVDYIISNRLCKKNK